MRFLARLGGVVLNRRGLLMMVLEIRGLDVEYCLTRLRYVKDSGFILNGGLCCAEEQKGNLSRSLIQLYIRNMTFRPG